MQGEQVTAIWKPLFQDYGIHIDFAYPSFEWESEASNKANVFCVIIGFSCSDTKKERLLYKNGVFNKVENINPYLLPSNNVFVEPRNKPIDNENLMWAGGKPTDGGYLILSEQEKNDIIEKNKNIEKYIRPYMMGKDFIERKNRYCLWLVDVPPNEYSDCKEVINRIKSVKEFRLSSTKTATVKKAQTPMLFDEIRESECDYIAIPSVSSNSRRYIPIDYLSKDIIPGNMLYCLSVDSLYLFGILTSNVHMSWMRTVSGKLGEGYRYSNTIVYNTFPFPQKITPRQKVEIEQTAQQILDVRAKYPDCSLADLYDDLVMPSNLREAHRANDRAVMQAYGFPIKMTESECVAELMKMYENLTK